MSAQEVAALQQQMTTMMRELQSTTTNVQALTAQNANLQAELQRVQGENQALNNSIGPLVQAVPGIAAEVTQALKEMKKGKDERVKGLIDVKGIGKPYTFEEKEEKISRMGSEIRELARGELRRGVSSSVDMGR